MSHEKGRGQVFCDRVDAAMLAAYGRVFPELVPSEPKGAFFDRLESMLVARACVIDKRTSMQQTSAEVDQPERTLLARLVNTLETEIETLNASIKMPRDRSRHTFCPTPTWHRATGS